MVLLTNGAWPCLKKRAAGVPWPFWRSISERLSEQEEEQLVMVEVDPQARFASEDMAAMSRTDGARGSASVISTSATVTVAAACCCSAPGAGRPAEDGSTDRPTDSACSSWRSRSRSSGGDDGDVGGLLVGL